MKGLKKINWKQMLLDNWLLKLVSLTLAFILWFVVIIEEDPVESKTFYGIKVNLVNTEKLEELGRVYEVLDGTDTIRSVTVQAPKSILEKLQEGDITAQADLNNISGMNTVEIEYSCPGYSRDITDIDGNISNVKLSIEDKKSKSINIKYNVIGEVAEGYMISSNGGISVGYTRLQVTGPASKVEQAAYAVADIDVSGSESDINTSSDLYLVDIGGNKLDFSSVEQSIRTVNVGAKVLKIKEIPVTYEVIGEPAEGYLMTGVVDASPLTVKIAGSPANLKNMEGITVSEELDMTGATESLVTTIDLKKYLRTGIIFADEEYSGEAAVTVYVEEEQERNLRLRRDNLQVINAPEGILAEVFIDQEMPLLKVKGLEADVMPLRESALKGTIDVAAWMEQHQLESLSAGIHSLPVEFTLAEGQTAVNEVFVQIQFSVLEEIEE